jgi:hypothetical protein
MSYEAITDSLVTVLQAMTRFANADVAKGDDRILGHGKADCLLLYPGPFTIDEEAQNREDRVWTVYIDYFRRVSKNPGADWILFGTSRDDLINTIRKYPNISQSTSFIKEVEVSSKGDAVYVFDEYGKGPFFIVQRISIAITESVAVTGGDYD